LSVIIRDMDMSARHQLEALRSPSEAHGALRGTLAAGVEALAASRQAVEVLCSGGDWTPEKHESLKAAIHAVEKAQRQWVIFDKSSAGYVDVLGAMPISPDTLTPEARADFEEFRNTLGESFSQVWTDLGRSPDERALHLWYDQLLGQLTPEYWDGLRNVLLSEVHLGEDPRSPHIQIARQEADAQAKAADA